MKLNDALLKILEKPYGASSMAAIKFRGKDVSFKTDAHGNPVVLFIGKLQADGRIKGDRYVRTLIRDVSGKILKDHWDLKGKA